MKRRTFVNTFQTTVAGVGIALLLSSGSAFAHKDHRSDRHYDTPVRYQHSHAHHYNRYAWTPRQVFRYLQWERERDYRHGMRKFHHKRLREERRFKRHQRMHNAYERGYRDARRDYRKAARRTDRDYDKRDHRHERHSQRRGFDVAKGGQRDRYSYKQQRGS